MASRKHDCRGFTLVEVLVASVLITVAVLSILAIFPQSLRMTRESGHTSVLNHLAAQQVEYLRSIDYTDSDLAIGTHPTIATDSTGEKYYPVSGFSEDFSMRWIVAAGPTDGTGTAEAKMKTVTVEATHLIRYDASGNPIDNAGGTDVVFQTFLAE